jgi:hypothetical protein
VGSVDGPVRLGEHTVALRTYVVTGQDPRFHTDVTERLDVKVDGCLVTPATATEPEDASTGPKVTGYQLLAPPGVPIDSAEAVIWPITGTRIVDGREEYDGPEYQVEGDVGQWEDAQQARVIRRGS